VVGTLSTTLDGGNGTGSSCPYGSAERVLAIDGGSMVSLDMLTVQGGLSSQAGAGIFTSSSVGLTLTDVVVRDNHVVATGSGALGGGGVYLGSTSVLTLQDSEVTANSVTCSGTLGSCARGGGFVTEEGATVTVTDSRVADNVVTATLDAARGGGIYLGSDLTAPSTLAITGSTISGNVASGGGPAGAQGGGIATTLCGSVELDRSVLEDNEVSSSAARAFGGGLAATFCGEVVLSATSVRGNRNAVSAPSVGAYGGGVYLSEVEVVSVHRSTFAYNEAVHAGGTATGESYGGGLYVYGYTATLTNTTISGNRSEADGAAYGGGLFAKGDITLYLVQSTVADNEADGLDGAYGGGVSHFPSSAGVVRDEEIVLLNTILSHNASTSAVLAKGPDCFQTTYTLGSNLLSDDTDCFLDSSLALSVVADQLDVDPGLEGLLDNGGFVATHALPSSSPARGASTCQSWTGRKVPNDARGVRRDRSCDLGAWEYADP
jgi:hypothetical protein